MNETRAIHCAQYICFETKFQMFDYSFYASVVMFSFSSQLSNLMQYLKLNILTDQVRCYRALARKLTIQWIISQMVDRGNSHRRRNRNCSQIVKWPPSVPFPSLREPINDVTMSHDITAPGARAVRYASDRDACNSYEVDYFYW